MRGWLAFGAVFFIFSAVVCAIQLWPNSAWLKLNSNGLHYSVLFVGITIPGARSSASGLLRSTPSSASLVSFWVEPNDRCISLNDSFGKKPEQLVEILESHWKRPGGSRVVNAVTERT